ncbi:hypothetical protein ACLF6K_09235 [Streptomyces xanthophaeus]|uniref:hypothetical protein n=1 Tax=Streptomyces xanthophaeus TaxID=67385 RepID=UPI00398FBCA0
MVLLLGGSLAACTTNECGGDRGGSSVCINHGAAPDLDAKYKQQVVAACGQLRSSYNPNLPMPDVGDRSYGKKDIVATARTARDEYQVTLDTLWRQPTPAPFEDRQATAKAAGEAWLADVDRIIVRMEAELPNRVPLNYQMTPDAKETATRQTLLQALTALGEKECSLDRAPA